MENARRGYFVDERGHVEPLPPLFPGGKPDLGQRAVDEIPQARQAAAENRSGAAVDGDRASLQRVKGEQRGIEEVAKLVSRLPETLDFLRGSLSVR